MTPEKRQQLIEERKAKLAELRNTPMGSVRQKEAAAQLRGAFESAWKEAQGPELHEEFYFNPNRRWRFDFAHVETRVAIEIEGGVFTQGRHTRGSGFEDDCEKYNCATAMGWRVFRLTTNLIRKDQVAAIVGVIAQTQARRELTLD
jgi:very-short-patch-repair endonuclease